MYGIRSIPEISMGERIRLIVQFSVLYSEFSKCSGIYLPSAIAKRIPMSGMTGFLIGRFLHSDKIRMHRRESTRHKSIILNSSVDFLKFVNFIHDPLRFSMNSFTDKRCQRPIACCWHPGINRLLVTTADTVFTVFIGPLSPGQRRFQILCKMHLTNNYGIDVSTDGLIVVIGYNSNRIYLIESNGKEHGVYEIVNALVQQQLLPRNDDLNYSGVSFSHDGRYILCFSNKGIQVIDRSGKFICTFGSFGAKPGFFRSEGQIVRLSRKNQFAISDIGNNRVQIVEIDWEQLTLNCLTIIGNNCLIDPLGIVLMGNCIVTFSYSQQMFYVYKTSGEVIEVPTQLMPGTRIACSLPDGRIVIVNQSHSLVTLIQENLNIPITRLFELGLKELKL